MISAKKGFFILIGIIVVGSILLLAALREKIQSASADKTASAEAIQVPPAYPNPPADGEERLTGEIPTEDIPLPLLEQGHLKFDINANGSQVQTRMASRSLTECGFFTPVGTSYHTPHCSLYIYEDNSSSAFLIDQDILRERVDFAAPHRGPLQHLVINENGKTIQTKIVYLPDDKRKELTFASNGELRTVDLHNGQNQSQHIAYLKSDFSFPLDLTIHTDTQKILYRLTPQNTYEKYVYLNNSTEPNTVQEVRWQVNEKGQAALEDGQVFPNKDFWGTAPEYCKLYPHDCITQ